MSLAQTQQRPTLPTQSRGLEKLPVVLSATLLSVGVWILLILLDSASIVDGLRWGAVFSLPLLPILWLISFPLLKLSAKQVRRILPAHSVGPALLGLSALCAVGLVLIGAIVCRPLHRFASLVLDPPPQSLANLQIGRHESFCDGYAWYFGFRVAPADFELIARKHQLLPFSIDWDSRRQAIENLGSSPSVEEIDMLFPEDAGIRRWENYHRPSRPAYYRGDRVLAVWDADNSFAWMMIDRWRVPAIKPIPGANDPTPR